MNNFFHWTLILYNRRDAWPELIEQAFQFRVKKVIESSTDKLEIRIESQ